VNAPLGITLDSQGRFAYIADTAASAVRIYSVNASTGTLAEIDNSPVGTGGAPHYVAIEPSGRYAYVSVPGTTSIVKFAVDANTGRLSAPVTEAATDDVQDLVITPNGRWLMATSVGGSTVYSYTINASDGELGAEVALDLGGTVAITSIALDLSGRFAYITNTTNGDGELRQFQINAQTGALSPVGLPFGYDAIGVPKGIAVDPKGGFMYSADSSGNGVSMFSINSTTGAPTYRGSTPAGTNPIAITTDYSGDFVRVATANGELLTFSVNRDTRNLTLIDTETGGGATTEPATIVTSSHAE
jgi:6-phosphogluconolactonase